MTVSNIKNTFLRRTVIILLYVPLVIVNMIYVSIIAVADTTSNAKEVWREYRP